MRTPAPPLSKHFPLWHALSLQSAAALPPGRRIAEIDKITDQLATLGVVRSRDNTARAAEWDARRERLARSLG